ncbi:MobH family relaxase (plasmid) [Edwardsiella tarda]|uniref:MobH family relaxase n=1 Tax=Edwardsiella tarda TaxID=636 RepID=UPI003F656143
MLKALYKLFGKDRGETTPNVRVLPLHDIEDEDIPRYPPFAKGLPVAQLDRILATQAELIEKVRNSLGFTVEEFNRLVLPVIQRYAAFVHLLPASESHHHRGAGGLFRHGLEVAFWSSQASESVIFSIEGTPRERRDNEPRWRLASCFSGLLHDVGKPLSDVSITDKNGVITWNPYSESLYDWASRHDIDRYFIRWRDKRHKRHEQFSLLAVDRIIPANTREFLSVSGPSIIEAMLEAIAGTSVNQPVAKLMLAADQESVARDLRQSRLNVDEFSYGVPVERYVFDAIRRLVKTGKWKVNEPGARVWHLHQGVFIAWKQLGELYDLISHDKIPGIPRDPDTLADILIERGFAIPNTVTEKGERAYYRYWEVLPEILQEGSASVKILMLRLESNDLVFTSEPPAVTKAEVIGDVAGVEIKFTDPDSDSAEQDSAVNEQGEDESVLSSNVLAAAQEADKALADIGFGDVMSLMGDLSHEDNDMRGLPSVQGDRVEDSPNETQSTSPDSKGEEISPQEIAQSAPPLDLNNPLKALQDVTWDFSHDGVTSEQNPPSPTNPSTMAQVAIEQSDSNDPGQLPEWAVETIPMSFGGVTDPIPEDNSPQYMTGVDEIPSPSERAILLELLTTYGEATELLKRAILPVLEGKSTLGEVICLIKGQVVVLYPDGASSIGVPSEVLSSLYQAGAIDTDPCMPNRKVRDFDGVKAIALEERLSNAIVAAIKEAESSMRGYQGVFVAPAQLKEQALAALVSLPKGQDKTATTLGSATAPSQSGSVLEKQSKRRKRRAQRAAKDDEGTEKAIHDRDSITSRQRSQSRSALAELSADTQQPVDSEKQNIAHLPVREKRFEPIERLAQQPTSQDKVAQVAVSDLDAEWAIQAKRKGPPEDLPEDIFLPPKLKPEQAIEMLKEMIQKRSGRWLVSSVEEQDGYLVTSARSLDVIADSGLGVSKFILSGVLSRAQNRPVLKKIDGKLYLEVNK